MPEKNKFFQVVVLLLSILVVLACSLIGSSEGEQPDPSAVQTDIANRVIYTSLANEQQMTLQAIQAQMTVQAMQAQTTLPTANVQPSQTSAPQPPTQNIPPSPSPTNTETLTPAPLVLEIRKSVGAFYCYQSPYELTTITVKVSDIDRGMAVY